MSEHQSILRLAVISTPRSGNTWLRAMLAGLYGLEQIPVHFPAQIDWDNLPACCVIQLHWYPVESFVETLARHEVRVVALARHPFDVLTSWLNYSNYVHLEGYCPGKETCDKCEIVGVLPTSDVLLGYVGRKIGHWLLGHSPAWWNLPGVLRVRYEDLVAAPEAALGRLAVEIGEPPSASMSEVVELTSIRRMKPGQDVWHYHYWQGRPGLWRELIPSAHALALARACPEPFEVLGYTCDPDDSLGSVQAELNWLRLQLDSTREHLSIERTKHRQRQKDHGATWGQLELARQALADEQNAHAETRLMLAASREPATEFRDHPPTHPILDSHRISA